MKKLLILNGSHSDIPLIEAGKKLGYYIITTGNNPNLIGHKYSDEYSYADFSNREEVLSLSKKLQIDAICSCANDFGAITASYVSEILDLPGHDKFETTFLLHQKDTFKQFAASVNLKTPTATCYNSLNSLLSKNEEYNYPLIVKPVDLTGGKGVAIVDDAKYLKIAAEKAFSLSRVKRILIENFIAGNLHSFSTFLLNQKVVYYYSDNEYSPCDPFHVTTSISPAYNINLFRDELIEQIELIASKLSLVDGIFHLQYIVNKRDIYIIDITRRCSGDFYPVPVKYSLDIDWTELIIKSESGIKCDNIQTVKQKGYFGRHCIVAHKDGILNNITITNKLESKIINRFDLVKNGEVIKSNQKISILFIKLDFSKELKMMPNLKEYIHLDIN